MGALVVSSNSAAESLDVIRQFVKDMEFVWPESPKDEEQIGKDITEIIESWDLGEQAEGCFRYVNYGIIIAKVSLASHCRYFQNSHRIDLVFLWTRTKLQSQSPPWSHYCVWAFLSPSLQRLINIALPCSAAVWVDYHQDDIPDALAQFTGRLCAARPQLHPALDRLLKLHGELCKSLSAFLPFVNSLIFDS